MFRASSAHLQEDTIVYMQHMVVSLSTRVRVGLSVHSSSCATTGHTGRSNIFRICELLFLHTDFCST